MIPIKTWLSGKEKESKFKKALLNAVDESLNRILGETATQTVYFHLEQKYHLKLEDIPDNLEDFHFALERIFGIGALVIEKTIMENLYSQVSLNNKGLRLKYKDREQFTLINYIKDLRSICVKEGGIIMHETEAFVIYDEKWNPIVYVIPRDELTPQQMRALMEIFKGTDNEDVGEWEI